MNMVFPKGFLWRISAFLAGSITYLLVAATQNAPSQQFVSGPQAQNSYNPFSLCMISLGSYYVLADELKLTENVLKKELIQELMPKNILENNEQFNWEFTTMIGIETMISEHFIDSPNHKPVFDHAINLWRKQNRDIILGSQVESIDTLRTTKSSSVAREIFKAALAETKLTLESPEECENLIGIIEAKMSLELLYTALPTYKRILFAKISSYFESGQMNNIYDLSDEEESHEKLKKIANKILK